MNYQILDKLKKYLFFMSIVLFALTWSHLSYIYLTYDADFEAIPGWTISEALIWGFPNFNPLLPSNDHNKYINGLLYRSLLSYDQENKKFDSDLASCNIEKLWNIECVLKENLNWSDGTNITADDVIATYNIIRQTWVHPLYSSLLKNVSIQRNGNVISFTTWTQDINILSLFLQPILPKKIVDTLDSESVEWKFSDVNGIFSWIFIISNIIMDETTGVSRITLQRNENYFQNPTYIEYLIINLFRDEAHFLQNRNRSFNIKYDRDGLIGNTIPRLESYNFTTPQFTSIFHNTQNIDKDLRAYINSITKRDDLIHTLWKQKIKPIYNPFFSKRLIEKQQPDFSFEAYLASKWYYSKEKLINQYKKRKEVTIESELFSENNIQEDSRPVQKGLNIVKSPTTQKYNFINSDNVLIEWSVPNNVDAVYINDYRLQGFSKGDRVFFYRLLKNFDSIVDWENKYNIYFEIDGKKEFQETFFYYLIEEDIDEYKENFFQKKDTNTSNTNMQLDDLLEIEMSIEEIESLNSNRYYTVSWEMFNLKLISIQTDMLLTETLQIIQNKFENNWIELKIKNISLWELTTKLREKDIEYDMILLGIDTWYFSGNIYAYFHSSQVNDWYNLSRFSHLWLDILLEELRSKILTKNEEDELQEKILTILENEQLIKTLYTNNHRLLIDRNIYTENIPSKLSGTQMRQSIFKNMYYNESKMIQWENKNIINGLRFIFSQLF